VYKSLQLILLVLLVRPAFAAGQQDAGSQLATLLAAAQQARAARDYAAAAEDYKRAVNIKADVPQLWANLGLMQHETGDINGALLSFQRAHRLDASLYVPNLFLGIDSVRAGKAKEAVAFLETAEKENATDPQAPLALGRAYLVLGELPQAARALNHAIGLDMKLSSAWFALGIAYLDQVETAARTLTDIGADSAYAQALYAESLEKQSRYREASALFEKILAAEPQPPCLRSELGYSLLRQHDSSPAETEFKTERAAHPGCALAILGQARLDLEAGSDEQALQRVEELWRRDRGYVRTNAPLLTDALSPEQAAGWAALLAARRSTLSPELFAALTAGPGSSAQEAGEASAAKNAITKNAGAAPLTAEGYFAVGEFQLCAERVRSAATTRNAEQLQLLTACAFFTGDFEHSSLAAETLAALDPHSLPALYWQIKAHEQQAFQALARFQQLEPDSARSHILLGDIYRQRERYDDAVKEYQRALEIAPGDAAALLGLASAYLSNDDIAKAMDTAQEALAHVPDDPELNLLMAEALIDKHDFAGARPFLDKSTGVKPQMLPHLHALLGKVDAETGRPQDAIRELNLGASSDVDGSIHYQLARLYREAGDEASAAKALETMKTIKQQRRAQRPIAIEDQDLTKLEAGP
jgi:tetratricopeptide (TPR) repeat protein